MNSTGHGVSFNHEHENLSLISKYERFEDKTKR